MHHLFKDNACNQYVCNQLCDQMIPQMWAEEWKYFVRHVKMSNQSLKADGNSSQCICMYFVEWKTMSNDTPDNMTQQRWKGWLDCISEYIMYTFDKQARQDWKPAHSETLLSSVSLWMIFIIIIWIIRILWPRCWFCTSSGDPSGSTSHISAGRLLKVFDS